MMAANVCEANASRKRTENRQGLAIVAISLIGVGPEIFYRA
jgi:hypothetical protein